MSEGYVIAKGKVEDGSRLYWLGRKSSVARWTRVWLFAQVYISEKRAQAAIRRNQLDGCSVLAVDQVRPC